MGFKPIVMKDLKKFTKEKKPELLIEMLDI